MREWSFLIIKKTRNIYTKEEKYLPCHQMINSFVFRVLTHSRHRHHRKRERERKRKKGERTLSITFKVEGMHITKGSERERETFLRCDQIIIFTHVQLPPSSACFIYILYEDNFSLSPSNS